MQLSQQLQQIRESATVALADRVRKLKAEGKHIIALQTGDPDFATPEPIVEAAYNALRDGMTHYADSRGLPELREAICHKLSEQNCVHYDPKSEVLVTNGGVHAYFCALKSIVNQGDEVLVPDPAWMTHTNMVTMVGGQARRVPSRSQYGFWPQMEDWERSVSPNTVALLVNSPNNPTGRVASADYLCDLVQLAVCHNLYIISDEVYEDILFDGREHVCVASLPGARQRTLLINSFSKTYAMTGWRIGYLAASAPVISQALKVSQHSITNVAPFVQRAALCALTDSEVAATVKQMVEAYRQRRDLAMNLLRLCPEVGVSVVEPEGAFYLFLDTRQLKVPSAVIAERLLSERSVSVVPGAVYGDCGEGFLRMTIAASEEMIEMGIRGVQDWASQRFSRVDRT